jgi:hypothetical protein
MEIRYHVQILRQQVHWNSFVIRLQNSVQLLRNGISENWHKLKKIIFISKN